MAIIFEYVLTALVLVAFAVYGLHFSRTPKARMYRELGFIGLIRGVSVLGLFMGVVLIGYSFVN